MKLFYQTELKNEGNSGFVSLAFAVIHEQKHRNSESCEFVFVNVTCQVVGNKNSYFLKELSRLIIRSSLSDTHFC